LLALCNAKENILGVSTNKLYLSNKMKLILDSK